MSSRRALALALAVGLTAAGCTGPPNDPWESMNRPVFAFNEGADRYVVGPIAKGWTFVTFEAMREAVQRFFTNLEYPRRLLTNLGQGKLRGAGSETGRFLVNTTVGIVGLFDPARRIGLDPSEEDFGQMFGRWGVGAGPYWVLPLLGPSNPRDAVGRVFDTAASPLFWLGFAVTGAGTGANAVQLVNLRAIYDDDIELARETALDYYVFVRNAFVQRRQYVIEDREAPDPLADVRPRDDLYEFDLDEEEPDDAP